MDYLGNELKIGDKVLVITKKYLVLVEAEVVKITPKGAKVVLFEPYDVNKQFPITIDRASKQIIKI